MTNAKRRQALLALARDFERPTEYNTTEACALSLRQLVDRLFPLATTEPEPPEEPHPVVIFPVIGGGTYGVGAEKVAELAKLYEVPAPYLLEQLGIVAAKIQAGAVSKKTRKGMSRALFAWSSTAKTIHQRSYPGLPSTAAREVPPTNGSAGAARLVRMAGEDVVLYRGETYRRGQWPAEYGPWPGEGA